MIRLFKNQTLLGLAICFAGVMLWMSPWWAGGKNLAPLDLLHEMMEPWRAGEAEGTVKNHIVSDGVDQYLVYRMVAAESYAKEGWVGWSSLTYGGTAQYANTMALYFDWTMQLHRWFEFWTAWHLGLAAQLFLAAAGMFLFLRGRAIGLFWACCGALLYAGNSQFVTWVYHRWALGSFCWVPWILWAIDASENGKKGFRTLVPLFIALGFLGGTLQHAALVVLVVVAAWIESAIRNGKDLGSQVKTLGRFSIWGILGAGLAAMMFVPCIDAFLVSNRLGLHTGMHGNAEMGVYPHGWLQPLYHLASYPFQMFPSIFGRSGSVDLLKAFKSELLCVAYFGSLPVLVAYLAIFRKKAPLLARALIILGLLLPLTPLVRLLYQRLFLLFILGGIFAFVQFMQGAEAKTREKVFNISAVVTVLAGGAWALVSVGLYLKRDQVDAMVRGKLMDLGAGSTFGFFEKWMNLRIDHFLSELVLWSPQQLLPFALWLVALFGLKFSANALRSKRRLGAVMVAGAVLLEVGLFGSRWVVWSDPVKEPLFPETAETEVLRNVVGDQGRVACINHPTAHMARTPFIPNTLSAYGIATSFGYDSIVPNGMNLEESRTKDPVRLGRLGVSHLITYAGNPEVLAGWERVFESASMELYENPYKVPRYQSWAERSDVDAFFDGATGSSGLAAEETLGLENERELIVPANSKWVRVAENYGNGWKFRFGSEGDWKEAERGPDGSILLSLGEVSADGRGSLVMKYDPPMRKMGMAISGVSIFLVLGGAIGELFGNRRAKRPEESPSYS